MVHYLSCFATVLHSFAFVYFGWSCIDCILVFSYYFVLFLFGLILLQHCYCMFIFVFSNVLVLGAVDVLYYSAQYCLLTILFSTLFFHKSSFICHPLLLIIIVPQLNRSFWLGASLVQAVIILVATHLVLPESPAPTTASSPSLLRCFQSVLVEALTNVLNG